MKNATTKYIFCPTMFTDIEDDIKKSRKINPISGHYYQENIIKGLIENGADVTIINIPRVRSYPYYSKVFIPKTEFTFNCIDIGKSVGCINMPIISRITKKINFQQELLKVLKENENRRCVLITFNSYDIQSQAILGAKQRYANVITCDIIADLHGRFGIINSTPGIRGYCIRKIEAKQDDYAKRFDSYVLLTDEMKKPIGLSDKPYVIIEGMYNSNDGFEMPKYDGDKKIVFYAGSIDVKYGIEHLLRAFCMIKSAEYSLIVAGIGNGEPLVKKYSKEDNRIKYLGFVSPKQVKQWQKKATVLVSPRTTEHEYVKYSFPSKTMECLASGVPYIAHRLPCEPEEYQLYIDYPKDESDESLRNEIVRVCSMTANERKKIGLRNREFIIKEKNPYVECKKIIEMIEHIR